MRASSAAVAFLTFVTVGSGSVAVADELGWAGRLGGTGLDRPEAVAAGPDGSTVVVGFFDGSADFDPGPSSHVLDSAGGRDAFAVKLDSAGRFVWARSLGGPSNDEAHGVAIDGEGDVWVVGEFEGTVDFDPGPGIVPLTAASRDAFVWKLDAAGALVWAGRVGGDSNDVAQAVALGGFGVVYVVGTYVQTADLDPGPGTYELTSAGNEDVFVLKLDATGGFLWARGFGGPSYDDPYGVAIDTDERVWTVGRFSGTSDFDPGAGTYEQTASGFYDGFVATLDRTGAFVSAGRIGGTGRDWFDGVVSNRALGVYAVGTFEGTADLDPGEKEDERTSAGGYDVFVASLSGDGTSAWTAVLGGGADDYAAGVSADGTGQVLAVGKVQGTPDFDPGGDAFPLTASSYDGFVWKLDAAGQFRWAGLFGGASDDGARAVAAGEDGSVLVVGDFFETADFDPGPDVFSLTPAGSYDAWFVRLERCGAFSDPGGYGRLVFSPTCTSDAGGLPGAPGTPQPYGAAVLGIHRSAADRFFLSSSGDRFAPLVVDDAILVGGVDAGLGPYDLQAGVPPYLYDVPIDRNLVPVPPREITGLIATGTSDVSFASVDVDRAILGRTAVYLVADCGLVVDGRGPTMLTFVSHDDDVFGTATDFDVRGGRLSELRADGGFARSACGARFLSSAGQDPWPVPPPGDGRYYLARALNPADACEARGYGEANGIDPDPRSELAPLPACP